MILTDMNSEDLENVKVVKEVNKKTVGWFDFIICDNEISSLSDYLRQWTVPIISENSHMLSILNEFDPVKNIWNSFLYMEDNKWSIFYALVRYLENSKFSFDNRNLVKNILEI